MLRFMISVIVMVIMVGLAARHFTDIAEDVETTEAEASIEGFRTALVNLHKTWILKGRPSHVKIQGMTPDGAPAAQWIFLMNEQGWPINVIDGNDRPDCKALWYALQSNDRLSFATRLLRMRRNLQGDLQAVAVRLDSHRTDPSMVWVCDSQVAAKVSFRYRLDSGKVEIYAQETVPVDTK